MAISNNSTGLRPGVCTSTTRPTAPYEGQMIYETDTDLTYVWGGSAWQQVSGGTAVGNSGLVYITTSTIGTGVSSVVVSNCFSATYDNYLIVVSGGVGSVAGENVGLTMGSTTTGYRNSINGVTSAGASSIAYDNNTNNKWIWAGGSDTTGTVARIELLNPFLSLATFMEAQMIRAGVAGHWKTFGSLANTTSYTGFTITPGSGTLTGGTVRVYGYRQA